LSRTLAGQGPGAGTPTGPRAGSHHKDDTVHADIPLLDELARRLEDHTLYGNLSLETRHMLRGFAMTLATIYAQASPQQDIERLADLLMDFTQNLQRDPSPL
jgi:hypothetical protein